MFPNLVAIIVIKARTNIVDQNEPPMRVFVSYPSNLSGFFIYTYGNVFGHLRYHPAARVMVDEATNNVKCLM